MRERTVTAASRPAASLCSRSALSSCTAAVIRRTISGSRPLSTSLNFKSAMFTPMPSRVTSSALRAALQRAGTVRSSFQPIVARPAAAVRRTWGFWSSSAAIIVGISKPKLVFLI